MSSPEKRPASPTASENNKQAAVPSKVSSEPKASSSKSIVLEQNGETKILKKIKLKAAPKFKLKPPEKGAAVVSPPKPDPLAPPPAKVQKEKPFECSICRCGFASQKQLKTHFAKHGKQSTMVMKSTDAGKGSSNSGQQQQEGAILLIECEWCPETFTSMSKAIEHKYRKHNYESKNYFCKLCGRLFPLKVALEQHQSLEHKDGSGKERLAHFICGFCGTAFVANDALELHVKTAHNLEKRMMAHPFVPTPSKKVRLNQAGEIISIYYCHLCGSEYMLKFNLLKHIEDHHSYEERCAIPEDLLKCSTCDSVFCHKRAFDAHNIHHKPEDLYVTSEEHRLNIVARVDQDFDFRRIPTAMDKALSGTAGSSDSAAALAKKHRSKAKKKGKASAAKASTSTSATAGAAREESIPVLDLSGDGGDNPTLEALQRLLGD